MTIEIPLKSPVHWSIEALLNVPWHCLIIRTSQTFLMCTSVAEQNNFVAFVVENLY